MSQTTPHSTCTVRDGGGNELARKVDEVCLRAKLAHVRDVAKGALHRIGLEQVRVKLLRCVRAERGRGHAHNVLAENGEIRHRYHPCGNAGADPVSCCRNG